MRRSTLPADEVAATVGRAADRGRADRNVARMATDELAAVELVERPRGLGDLADPFETLDVDDEEVTGPVGPAPAGGAGADAAADD